MERATFYWMSVFNRLRGELIHHLNPGQPESQTKEFLMLPDGRPVSLTRVANMLPFHTASTTG